MTRFYRHYVMGNGAPPWVVAGIRGLGAAILLSIQAGLASWTATGGDLEVTVIVSLNLFVGTLIVRWGIEGKIDQGKGGGE